MLKKIFIELRLRNLMIHVFKGHVKIVRVYMVKLNVAILNRLKIMDFLQIQSKYINIMPFLIKLTKLVTIFTKCFFPYLHPTIYLKLHKCTSFLHLMSEIIWRHQFDACKKQHMHLLFMTLIVWDIGTGFEIRVFCLTGHIWV